MKNAICFLAVWLMLSCTTNNPTGGGTDMGSAITVSSMSERQNMAAGTEATIIFVEPGTYKGALLMGANKTIIGTAPGVVIEGYIEMRADKKDAGGNIGTAQEVNQEWGTVFEIPYDYNLMPASEVKATVTAVAGGSGNTCIFQKGDTGIKRNYLNQRTVDYNM